MIGLGGRAERAAGYERDGCLDRAGPGPFQAQQAGVTAGLAGSRPACCGDSIMINQVFSNLLDNACKYRSPKRAGNQVIYRVQDNGIGIALERRLTK